MSTSLTLATDSCLARSAADVVVCRLTKSVHVPASGVRWQLNGMRTLGIAPSSVVNFEHLVILQFSKPRQSHLYPTEHSDMRHLPPPWWRMQSPAAARRVHGHDVSVMTHLSSGCAVKSGTMQTRSSKDRKVRGEIADAPMAKEKIRGQRRGGGRGEQQGIGLTRNDVRLMEVREVLVMDVRA